MSYWDDVGRRIEMGPEAAPELEPDTPETLLHRLRIPESGLLQGANFVDYLERTPSVTIAAFEQAVSDLGLDPGDPEDALRAVDWDDEEQIDRAIAVFDSLISEEE